jgi:sulfur transfer protein SufE
VTAPVHTDPSALLAKQQQRLAELLQIGDPQQRFARLMQDAGRISSFEPGLRIEFYRVEGCLARVWFVPEIRDGNVSFAATPMP